MEIPRRPYQRWDGESKEYTKDCSLCGYYRNIGDKDLCGWRIAFKYLIKTKNLKICEVKARQPVENPSVRYLDNIIQKIKNENKLDRKI